MVPNKPHVARCIMIESRVLVDRTAVIVAKRPASATMRLMGCANPVDVGTVTQFVLKLHP